MTDSVLAALEAAPFFAPLPQAVRAALAPAASTMPIRRKQRIFHQGDPADAMYLIRRGKVRLVQAGEDGSEVVVRFFGPGEVFAGIALVEGARYPVTAEAVEAGDLLLWDRRRLLAMAELHPELALATTRAIAGRMQELQERFREVATQRVDHRVARALQRLAEQTGRPSEDGVILDLPLSRLDLAEMTGTTLFTVSRLLSAWQRRGVLRLGRERVEILDPSALADLASSSLGD